jgi:hypothetical protein
MESEAGAATSHHAATAEPESTAAETAEPESTAADEDGATYMGVLQCRFGGRAWIEPSDGALGGRGFWGLGKQAYPRAQLFASRVTGEEGSKHRAKFHSQWRSPGDVFDTLSGSPYYANRSQRSCNNCRHYMRGHLQELKKAQDAETLRDGESGAADGGGASSAPGQDETGIDHASDQAVIFSLAARNLALSRKLKARGQGSTT